jgi:ABC-2 type transport system permease protein
VIGRVARLVVFEWQKLIARRLALAAPILVALVAVLAPLGGQALELASSLAQGKGAAGDPFQNGWTALARGLVSGFNLVAAVLLVFGASSISEEAQLGTLKSLFVRPIRRSELLMAKWIALSLFGVALVLAMTGAAVLVCQWRYGFKDLVDPEFANYVKHTRADMIGFTVRAVLLAVPGIVAMSSFCLLVSCAVDHPGYAVGTALAGVIGLFLAGGFSNGIANVAFTHYVGLSLSLLRDIAEQFGTKEFREKSLATVLVPGVSSLVFFGAAAFLLEKREVGD